MNMIRKGQVEGLGKGDIQEQVRLVADLFEVAVRLVLGREAGSASRNPRPGPSDNTTNIYSDSVCPELETLGYVSPLGAALDRVLLLTCDGARFLQLIGHFGDTSHELAVIADARGACRNA